MSDETMSTKPEAAGSSLPGPSAQEPVPPETAAQITRRRFLTLLFAAASAIGLGAFVAPLLRFAYPVVRGQVFEKLKIASTAAVTAEGVRFDYQDTPSMLIQKEDKSFAAFSLVCTHLGCIVKWETKGQQFHCPCHAGYFNQDGQVLSGPPPRPLSEYTLAIEGTDIYVEGLKT